MCQAYEGEASYIQKSEGRATIEGFKAAKNGEPITKNPHREYSIYEREAWNHGWRCFQSKLLPYAIECLVPAGPFRGKLREVFKKTGKIGVRI